MKLSLSTDFGSPHHWERVVEFAVKHNVSRLVFWGDYSNTKFLPPYLYPKYPKLMSDEEQQRMGILRDRLVRASKMTTEAGMEFWYVFQALEIPSPDRTKAVWPELFNRGGEPDMGSELPYQLLRDQLDELLTLVPNLYGIEMWVMECATIRITHLKHQRLSTGEICGRIVDTVYEHIAPSGLKLVQDLHTAGGDSESLLGLFKAATCHPDIILSGDNVIGDYHLHLPFNSHIARASKTNPVQVNFDLNAEYWGRNFVPSIALSQYAQHIEEARRLRAVYINGRVSTGHDTWSPHANVLPSRRRFYPALARTRDSEPLPHDLEVTSTDTLGAFNAEFFCSRAINPETRPEDVAREFLRGEFGEAATGLVSCFMKLEGTLGKIFYTDKNYFVVQSARQTPWVTDLLALDIHLTSPPGTPLPPPEGLGSAPEGGRRAAFAGWPAPLGHKCAGAEAMVREKEEALAEAQELLEEAKKGASNLKPECRDFLIKQFEDLVFFAKAFRFLLEAQAHYYLAKAGKRQGKLPNPSRFKEVLSQVEGVADEWKRRYPGGRYNLGETLADWANIIKQGF
jgi:hypothetical protein